MVDLYRARMSGTGSIKNLSTKVLRIYRVTQDVAGSNVLLQMFRKTGIAVDTASTFAVTAVPLSRNAAALPAAIIFETGISVGVPDTFAARTPKMQVTGTNGTTFTANNRPFSIYWDWGTDALPLQRLTLRNAEGLYFSGGGTIDVTFSCELT